MKMHDLLRRSGAFLAALVTAAVIASVFSTQFVLAALRDIDVAVPLADNFSMVFADLGVLKTLLPLAGVALLVAFLVAGLCARLGGSRVAWFAVAGFSAMIALLLIIEAVLQVMPLSGARSPAGLLFQGIAGAIGGILFANLTRPSTGEAHG